MSPLVASERQGWSHGITRAFSGGPTSAGGYGCLAGPWAAGKPLLGAWQPPKWVKETSRELAQLQEPSSPGGGGVVITPSLQPNHPSFIADSSSQAWMGFFFFFFSPVFL